ncbi:MAG: hypothetical protein WBN34_11430 [Woeseia sp.]
MRSLRHSIIKGGLVRLPVRGMFLMLIIALAACAAPPVQEMSDARQAITVARQAGAETWAARELREAEAYLASAEYQLEQREFARARFDARAAKNSALQALSVSERANNKTRD